MWVAYFWGGCFSGELIIRILRYWVTEIGGYILFSVASGEVKNSYGYDSSGKKALNSEFTEYGQSFGVDDVIGCYLVSSSFLPAFFKTTGLCKGSIYNVDFSNYFNV